MLISFAVTAKLICVFVFAYAKSRFSHDAAPIQGVQHRQVSVVKLVCFVVAISDLVQNVETMHGQC